jgi:hypothetical protein
MPSGFFRDCPPAAAETFSQARLRMRPPQEDGRQRRDRNQG